MPEAACTVKKWNSWWWAPWSSKHVEWRTTNPEIKVVQKCHIVGNYFGTIGYIFRPNIRSSSGPRQNKSADVYDCIHYLFILTVRDAFFQAFDNSFCDKHCYFMSCTNCSAYSSGASQYLKQKYTLTLLYVPPDLTVKKFYMVLILLLCVVNGSQNKLRVLPLSRS